MSTAADATRFVVLLENIRALERKRESIDIDPYNHYLNKGLNDADFNQKMREEDARIRQELIAVDLKRESLRKEFERLAKALVPAAMEHGIDWKLALELCVTWKLTHEKITALQVQALALASIRSGNRVSRTRLRIRLMVACGISTWNGCGAALGA